MRTLLRRARGIVGVGLTWGVSWALIGTAVGITIGIVDPDSIDPGESPLMVGALVGIVGFISGAAFSTLLAIAERRKTLRDLSLTRVALWGMLGSAALPLLTTMNNRVMLVTCPLGIAFATVSLLIARRGDSKDHRIPNADRAGT